MRPHAAHASGPVLWQFSEGTSTKCKEAQLTCRQGAAAELETDLRARDRSGRARGNERLYEAYHDLHCLASDFQKPFDA